MSPPLGIGYIAATLTKNGYDVQAVDLNISGMDPERVRRIIVKEDPAILGISAHTETYLNALKIASTAKRVKPYLPVVLGGPHATLEYEDAVRRESVDFVIVGEGEQTMLELVDSLLNASDDPTEIDGIAYEENGEVRVTPERSFIEDPDDLPFPARGLFPIYLYEYPGNILMSRGGCPFNCHFCAVNSIWRGRRRFRSARSVVDEILFIFRCFQVQEINFADDALTLDRDRIIDLCNHLRQIQVPFPWRWTCSTRVDLVDKELLQEMREAGCSSVQFGVEAGSQEILDSIGKGTSIEQVIDAVRIAKDVGLDVLCSFMFPHPEDTAETIREQKDFMKELAGMGAKETMAFTTPYPGTYYYEHAEELGIDILADSWDEFDAKHLVIATKYLSRQDLEALLEELITEVGLRQF